jgi:hypothetical protein
MDDMSTQIQSINAQTKQVRRETMEQFNSLSKGLEDICLLVTAVLVPPKPALHDETLTFISIHWHPLRSGCPYLLCPLGWLWIFHPSVCR